MIKVTLLYSPGEDLPFFQQEIDVPDSSTIAAVLDAAHFYEHYPEAKGYSVGVFSKRVLLTHCVEAGDRVEVYRPLQVNPKEARRLKAKINR